ncbi:GNAT family N-acetyltransferase [Waterburya agarophytonicola K14]|uniref:GNAT family N-acetyltransferase n=1 Tax=Waterburya agarophytonicola KI4 TaxID=2874699 RepID=A0A964BPR8_9CYAN|nr:GNAT family N-acetyltransferase [Waterburya agarophytonicola KI4]
MGELESNGHIDCFYTHYQYQGKGVGTKIYQTIENKAIELNLPRLYLEASITAKPFFIHQGFVKLKKQQVVCRGEKFTNYLMEKRLI